MADIRKGRLLDVPPWLWCLQAVTLIFLAVTHRALNLTCTERRHLGRSVIVVSGLELWASLSFKDLQDPQCSSQDQESGFLRLPCGERHSSQYASMCVCAFTKHPQSPVLSSLSPWEQSENHPKEAKAAL